MPVVSIDFLHEIVYGVARIIEYEVYGRFKPSKNTYSWRKQFKRSKKYWDWLTVRMNSVGWDRLGDRLEIVWGPDYQGRYDFFVFRGTSAKSHFCPLPDDHGFPVRDMRAEVKVFDVGKELRSIGVTGAKPYEEACGRRL